MATIKCVWLSSGVYTKYTQITSSHLHLSIPILPPYMRLCTGDTILIFSHVKTLGSVNDAFF